MSIELYFVIKLWNKIYISRSYYVYILLYLIIDWYSTILMCLGCNKYLCNSNHLCKGIYRQWAKNISLYKFILKINYHLHITIYMFIKVNSVGLVAIETHYIVNFLLLVNYLNFINLNICLHYKVCTHINVYLSTIKIWSGIPR